MHPGGADLFNRASHANRVNLRRRSECPDRYWNVIVPPTRVDDICEKKRAALPFRYAAQKLASYERVQFCVLIDWPLDSNEQAFGFKQRQVCLESRLACGLGCFSLPLIAKLLRAIF